ncbi:iron-containing alcohol dehydrogenase [Evansella cellulosilytica]|uniref:Iron-containing alcohol dehydrogenase n=1 Tax=Evansella cellulosilytica (strain ATCC 21833 / DSM 2522 / FERM P-1141 / JCM 9156 / N-4) TaxID=649639 RepID=E6TTH3_EVAC2|nr:iron-containing alcohol dehydrogenase [Evansella cellulosilytica]ADU29609.1 iron-containing alcohol dehydrogenase [Evansella cellulosilytica DSM 2522]
MPLDKIFRYELPTAIEFGNGAVRTLANHIKTLGGSKALLVTDPGVEKAGVTQKLIDVLKGNDVPFTVYNDIEPDPHIDGVMTARDIARKEECDCVIGVGGGSALDTAKAVGLMIVNEGHIRDYVGINLVPKKGAPVIAIPTTAGTGSELTIWSVMSDKEANAKLSVGSPFNCPDLALCDPELTVTLPANLTASTGMDALTHALESYVNKATQPISEGMSLQSMRMVAQSLRTAVAQGDHLQARYDMLLASLIAAMAFNPTRLGLSHALAIPLGAHFRIPHGTVNAILLPEVMKYNLPGNLTKYKEIAKLFDMPVDGLSPRQAAEQSVIAVQQLKEDVGIFETLSDYGVTEEDLDYIAKEAMLSGNVPVNPRQPSLEDLKQICRNVM